MQSIILDVAGTTEFPTTMYKLMQKFSQYTAKRFSTDGLFDTRTFKQHISAWKQQFGVNAFGTHIVRMCPKAAKMAMHGWSVWHAVVVSSKMRGTQVIGKVAYLMDVYFRSSLFFVWILISIVCMHTTFNVSNLLSCHWSTFNSIAFSFCFMND